MRSTGQLSPRAAELVDQLPRPDVVRECCKAYERGSLEGNLGYAIQFALRRFCELEGIPVPKYLEEL